MNIWRHPAYKACELREFEDVATGRTTRQVDEYVQRLFNSRMGEWIIVIDHACVSSADNFLVGRIVSRMKNEHGIEIEVKRHEGRWRIRIPISDAERLSKFRQSQHEYYVTEMKKIYPDWKEL